MELWLPRRNNFTPNELFYELASDSNDIFYEVPQKEYFRAEELYFEFVEFFVAKSVSMVIVPL